MCETAISPACVPDEARSGLAFSAPLPEVPTAQAAGASLAERSARVGEPRRTRIAPDELDRHLQALGFAEVAIPAQAEIDAWYIRGRQDGLRAPARKTIARATV